MADIFEQVDDALREDRVQRLWRRYGWTIIALAVLIVVGTGAVVGWRAYERSVAEDQTRALSETIASAAEAEPIAAIAALTTYADGAEPTMAAVARLRAAARAVEVEQHDTTIALYQQVADDAEVDPALRDLATILGASMVADNADVESLRTRLAGLEAANSPWRHLAGEIIAAAAMRAGDMETARGRLTAIADDPEAPIALRGRAAELLAALGIDAESDPGPDPVDEASDEGALEE